MALITHSIIWLALSGLIAMIILSNNPYRKAKKLADIALERIEVLKHKWLESEKAGYDIGMAKAQESWEKYHAKQWKASRQKLLN